MQNVRALLFLVSVHACLSSSLFDIVYSGKVHHIIFVILVLDLIFVKLIRLERSIQANAIVHYLTSTTF